MAAFWFVVLLVAGFAATAADSTSKPTYVTSLPGLDGPLPSRLETGYVTVDEENGAELFYYFVESEGDPRRDPVLLWLTGGDRCSVLSGLVFEIGPVELVREPYDGVSLPRLRRNPSSWTKVASILFVDSPVGAGFSFSRDPSGYDVGDISASLQLVKFLRKWFSEHEDYLANPFYVGGGSYAGKLVPFITQKISEGIEAGVRPTINLKGYTVGSPLTGDSSDFDSRVPYCHGVGIISDQLYKTIMLHCHRKGYSKPRSLICSKAMSQFNKLFDEISAPHILYSKCIAVSPGPSNARTTSGRKILKEEVGLLQNPPPRPAIECVEYTHYLLYFWVNNNATLETLGIKKGTVNEWVRCHQGDLPYDEDIENSIKYHRNVVSQDYRALVYSGDHDAVVPFLSTQAWVRSLTDLVVDDWRAWHLDGQSAGFTITYGNNVTFTTVKSGGHTVPEYQPERCFAMFSRWISNRPL
ncbi:serine carboxypeptidase-like 7 isoform X2 [Oryza brachyantha]|uniref:serine carboxypeptidase-like 7 isoform X2 n=1 Tax=Oryza brachyantha TaxID=4533 RepID=UPI0003EABE71|nr:serine carboxypeptidase-like 7 isoform X2 [Oryza brachyantha]